MASRQVSLLKSAGNSRIYRIKHKNRESLQHNHIILFNDKLCGDDRAFAVGDRWAVVNRSD